MNLARGPGMHAGSITGSLAQRAGIAMERDERNRPDPKFGRSKLMRQKRQMQRLAAGFSGLLLSGAFIAGNAAGADSAAGAQGARRIYLDCATEATGQNAGVEFKYTIDEAAETVQVNRWGEPADVKFGPVYITYRTLGMALKMNVSINRETWRFTMLHEDGVYVINGTCKEATRP
jgi:hypothetical protein